MKDLGSKEGPCEESEGGPGPRAADGGVGGRSPLGLFAAYGVELELMIVGEDDLGIRPVADQLLEAAAGAPVTELERGGVGWSNELVLHVLELKTPGPAASLEGLGGGLHGAVMEADAMLGELGCRLLPGGAHPWMDPLTEARIWPHENTEIYRTFDRIFSCRGHGWANLQSTHLNLPFADAREFEALHAAVRVVLPLVPALAASTPVLDGRVQAALDARMVQYARNALRVPSVTGAVIPEPVRSPDEYRTRVLERIYRDLAPLDPDGVLRHEWVNARGAIARFQRGAVEIRVVDAQESPMADLAVLALVAEVVRRVTESALRDPRPFHSMRTEALARLLDATVREADLAEVRVPGFLPLLGIRTTARLTAGDVWRELAAGVGTGRGEPLAEWREALGVILEEGPLARRLLRAVGPTPARERLRVVWGRMGDALRANRPFVP